MTMRYLSVCSGIEAATVAWHPLGWQPVGFSEIEPFPSAVLAHHYPDVPNYGDLTRYQEWNIDGPVELVVGGTPCQSFSVAGLRQGMADPRGNLALTFLGLVDHVRPRWVVWENVPGVLSSNGGRDFGAFLGALGQLGYGFAYRVLDAQFFGVAQRRRRVFVVGYLGDWRPAAAVLFERDSLRRDTAPRREARESVAPTVSAGPPFSRTGNERVEADAMIPVVGALDCRIGAQWAQNAANGHYLPVATSHVMNSQQFGGYAEGSIASTINARDYKDASDLVLQPITMRESGQGYWVQDNVAGTIDAYMGMSGHANRPAVIKQAHMQVRRLTPVECERLQGFPDGYTNIPWRKKSESPDGPRYKALGNSMAVPVMRWIGQRITQVEEILRDAD